MPSSPDEMNDDEEIEHEVFEFTTIALFTGLLQLIEAIAANGLLDDTQIRAVHAKMSAPLDDEKVRSNKAVCDLREAMDGSFALARAVNPRSTKRE